MYAKQKPVEYAPGGVLELFKGGHNKKTYILKQTWKSLVEGLLKYIAMTFCYYQTLRG